MFRWGGWHYIFSDKDTNEIVSIKAKDIHIPQKLGGVELTPMQQASTSAK